MFKINPAYNQEAVQQKLREHLESQEGIKTVQCQSFLLEVNQPNTSKFKHNIDPLHHNYREATITNSEEIQSFVESITKKNLKCITKKSIAMTWKEYQIIDDHHDNASKIDVILDITDNWPENAGGTVAYVDGDGNYHTVPTTYNALTVIIRESTTKRFLQYVNHYGKDKEKIFHLLEFTE